MNPRAIAIFAKAPVPGQVKTRLIGKLSPTQAAAIHARLTVETIRLVTVKEWRRVPEACLQGRREYLPVGLIAPVQGANTFQPSPRHPRGFSTRRCEPKELKTVTVKASGDHGKLGERPAVYLYCHPDTSHPFFQVLSRRFPVTLRPQDGGDLGQRMANALDECLSRHRQVLLLGCDCPSLTRTDIQTAFQSLDQGCKAVLGPAEDGGYVLIGATRPLPFLFRDVAWGSSEVLETTRERLRQQQLPFGLLPMQWDLDRPCDLERYHRLRDASNRGEC